MYYYADGKRVPLRVDANHVAVVRSAVPAGLLDAVMAGAPAASQRLGTVVLPRASMSAAAMAALTKAGAVWPVFRHRRAMMVALPEIRVDTDGPRQRDAVRKLLAANDLGVVIDEDGKDRLVLRPASGQPLDALKAANRIYEEARPAAASVRFLQFVPRPVV